MGSYAAFGMTIDSTIPLRLPPSPAGCLFDVLIRCESTSECPELPYRIESVTYGVQDGCMRIRVPKAADFLVRDGREILVAPVEGVSDAVISSLITGLVLGVMAHGRMRLTLHGSAVERGGAAFVLLGGRGSGKSTAAAALCRKGYRMLCDDMIPIGTDGRVWPGVPRPRLKADSYRQLFGDPALAADLWDGVDKYQLELAWSSEAAAPRAVFLLEPSACPACEAERISGWKKASELAPHIQRLEGLDDPADVLRKTVEWAAGISVFRIRRPTDGFRIDELLDCIESRSEEVA